MKKLLAVLLAVVMVLGLMTSALAEDEPMVIASAKSNDIVILYTNDVHCGIDDSIGYAGLAAYKAEMKDAYNYVTLVDCGDAVQGAALGTLSKGEYLVDILNKVGYDFATFGNHEFDYGMDQLQNLISKAEYTYLSCNFKYTGTGKGLTGYKPYEVVSYGETKVAFVGVSTPESIAKSTPTYFQDGKGNYVYTFGGTDGADLYKYVQETVDAARKEADYVVVLSHLGVEEGSEPVRSYDLIANTNGIDVVLDGHSHTVMAAEKVANKDGKDVILSQTGTKLANIGKLVIAADGAISTELISNYDKKDPVVDAFVNEIKDANDALLKKVVARTASTLSCKAPDGTRLVRNRETGIGDLCADAYRYVSGADIAFVNGGGIRADLKAGDITYENIIALHPYGNALYVVEATGQEILDALEWTARSTTGQYGADGTAYGECGGFLQVSGLKYTINTYIPTPCKSDSDGMFAGIDGDRRVSDVQVLQGGKYVPIDPSKTYTLASHNYMLESGGDGTNMFMDNKCLQNGGMLDNEILINYIVEGLNGTIPAKYAQPEGRITVKPTAFKDVPDNNWAAEAINYVSGEEIMKGISADKFNPNGSLTRAMIVTMLYRQAGSPAVEGKVSDKFTDCKDGWYADAVVWAASNKIVDGYSNGTFLPDKAITRQELAKVLYGYDLAVNGAKEVTAAALTYSDAANIAEWAKLGVAYCTTAGYLQGSNNAFNPKGTATRAMGAQVFTNMAA